MRIGELSRRSGVPRTALRFYEQTGLLTPAERTESGYRSYAEDALDRLAFIRSAQAVGLTLAEVRQVVGVREAGDTPCLVVMELIERRHADVRRRITELRHLEHELERLRTRARELQPRDCEPSGVCHVIPPASVASMERATQR